MSLRDPAALAGRRGRPTECCTVPDKLALPTGTVPLFQQAARGQRRPISLFSHAARHFDKKNPIGFLFPAPKLAEEFAATLCNRASSTGVHPFSGGPADPATKRPTYRKWTNVKRARNLRYAREGTGPSCPFRSIMDLSPFSCPQVDLMAQESLALVYRRGFPKGPAPATRHATAGVRRRYLAAPP